MKPLKTNPSGHLSPKDIIHFGGEYSTLEKIEKGGIGSTKLIYDSGLEAFDKLSRDIPGEIGFVNFELLKNGLILRLNINQRLCCLGVRLSDIERIDLVGYRIEIRQKQLSGQVETKIVHRGDMQIVERSGTSKFSVVVREFESIVNYLSKVEFTGAFNFSISTNPPEKDYGYLLGMLG